MSKARPRAVAERAREAVVQMLYALEIGGQDAAQVEAWYLAAHPLPPTVRAQAAPLLQAVVSHREQIEALIRQHATRWKLERISVIDRSLLKLSVAELLLGNDASAEVIDRILHLGQRFTQPEALGFLHAVQDAIARDIVSRPQSKAGS